MRVPPPLLVVAAFVLGCPGADGGDAISLADRRCPVDGWCTCSDCCGNQVGVEERADGRYCREGSRLADRCGDDDCACDPGERHYCTDFHGSDYLVTAVCLHGTYTCDPDWYVPFP